jgi:hypothetical protein
MGSTGNRQCNLPYADAGLNKFGMVLTGFKQQRASFVFKKSRFLIKANYACERTVRGARAPIRNTLGLGTMTINIKHS